MIWKFLFCTSRQNYHTFLLLCPIFLSFKLFIVIFIQAFHIKSNIHYLNIFKYLLISMGSVCVVLVRRHAHQIKVCCILSSEEVPQISWNWIYRQYLTTTWKLGKEPRSYLKATSSCNHWAIFPLNEFFCSWFCLFLIQWQTVQYLYLWFCTCMHIIA